MNKTIFRNFLYLNILKILEVKNKTPIKNSLMVNILVKILAKNNALAYYFIV